MGSIERIVRQIIEEGLENSWKRHEQNAELLWFGLEQLGLELHVEKKYRLPTLTTVKIPEGINGIALGMIETRGMVPAIEAADAMTKAAEVNLISREFVGGGYVSVLVRGETGAVNASVRAGADACERVGDGLVAAHIIARPHSEVEPVLQQSTAKRRL